MGLRWIKYHFLIFIPQGIYNYTNFVPIIPSGETIPYSIFFVTQYLFSVAYFYLNFYLISKLNFNKLGYLIPFQILIMIISCFILSAIPVVHHLIHDHSFRFANVYFFTMFPVVRFTSLSLGFKFLQGWYENEQEKEQLLKESYQAELVFLRAQINPHFLLNTLNSIYGLSLKQSPETYKAFSELKSLFGYISKVSDSEKTTLNKEVEYLENYIKLCKRRVGKDLELTTQINIDHNYTIEPLLLITFIENAFKHGISMKQKSFIHLFIEAQNGKLTYKIANSVHGFIRKDNTSGIGLVNLKRRLDIVYKGNYELDTSKSRDVYNSSLIIYQL